MQTFIITILETINLFIAAVVETVSQLTNWSCANIILHWLSINMCNVNIHVPVLSMKIIKVLKKMTVINI